jgi:hypothetical protein
LRALGLAIALGVSGIGIAGTASAASAASVAQTVAKTSSAPTPITPRPAAPEVPVDSTGTSIGSITDVQRDGASVTLTAEHGAMRVTFLEDGTFRL